MLKSEAKTSLAADWSIAHKPMTFMLAAGELTKIKTESTYFFKNFPKVSTISGFMFVQVLLFLNSCFRKYLNFVHFRTVSGREDLMPSLFKVKNFYMRHMGVKLA